MKIDWITVRVIGQIIFGFVVGVLIIGLLTGIIISFFVDDPPVITKNIGEQYYYNMQTSGFATSSTVTSIDILRKRKWFPDKKVGQIDKYVYGREDITLDYENNRLIMYVNEQIKVDTLVDLNGDFRIDCDKWLEIEHQKR